ncbi:MULTISPECIES: hypothetical protein [Sorangium]|uniref:Uncharacterized protein n=1 Tax=Sorangium cellulosum TaxID=56 RepID=A0A4P2QGD5_SORCE|nr:MULTISPECIES: hypothetical protein [Sorangium]AUX28899.1 hypothetical protein SOCE836_009840 [Sorangium cellulosum]WCQ88294.1 hypothetical protein NQZ70_00969 [Sorangium sp. Soce836]
MSTGSGTGELDVKRGDLLSKEPDEPEQPDQTQIPIDSKLRFIEALTESPLLQVAVTGSNPPPGYAAKAEYWSRRGPLKTSAIILESIGFTNRSGSAGYPKEFHDWLAGGSVLATAQEVSAQQWVQGVHQPTSPNSALYWAVDPDAPSTRRIGLLVELGSAGELLNVIWYKTRQPTGGLIFQKAPSRLTFTQVVVGEMKKPSTDPYDIDAQSTWYHYRGEMRSA